MYETIKYFTCREWIAMNRFPSANKKSTMSAKISDIPLKILKTREQP